MARQIPSPLLIDQDQLLANLEQIWAAAQRTGFRVLLDQTAFPAWPLYPMLGLYLSGTVAANAALAEQGLRHMDRDSHGVADGLTPPAFADLLPWCHHMTFCTLGQWEQLGPKARERRIPCSLRVSAGEMCRSGIPLEELPDPLPNGISGLQLQLTDPSDLTALDAALDAVEHRCAAQLPQLFQFSFGGNFPLTGPDFDLAGLEERLHRFRTRWHLLLYLEVGEAVAHNALSPLPHPPASSSPFQEGDLPLYVKRGNRTTPFSHF